MIRDGLALAALLLTTPCNTLHEPSLTDGHLAFGSEASATAALPRIAADELP